MHRAPVPAPICVDLRVNNNFEWEITLLSQIVIFLIKKKLTILSQNRKIATKYVWSCLSELKKNSYGVYIPWL